ncbi:putative DNA-binding protein (MmcQ/YjbR family) [Elusimicrobium posterum]|uniref:MmcQ/YjbR family DNA-binding protein n=1 Tax=Elusimicrobium posterum TaxID=3116653 RepID=UPI003C73AD79
MKYKWLEKYLLSKKGAVKEFHKDFGVDRFLVGGKMFVMWGGDKNEKPIATFKLDPAHGELLREKFKDIVPGYYMNKLHWNSLYLEGNVPDDTVKEMADESYRIILESLPKAKQKEISGK